MTEELSLLQSTVYGILQSALARPRLVGREAVDDEAWTQFQAVGIRRIAIDETWGGASGNVDHLAVILRAVGRHAATIPFLEDHLAAETLLDNGLDLPEGILSVATRSTLVAEKVGSGWRIQGRCHRVPWAADSSAVIGFAHAGDDVLIVSLPTARADVTVGCNVAGEPRDNLEIDVVLADVIRASIGDQQRMMSRALLYRALAMVGAAESALELTVEHVNVRQQFGRSLERLQVVQHAIVAMAARVAAASASADAGLLYCCERRLNALRPPALAARIEADLMAGIVARSSHQLHGAVGLTAEHRLRLFTTRLSAWRQDDMSQTSCCTALAKEAVLSGGPWNLLTG
jgi:acyl-CoA dehydrogenase